MNKQLELLINLQNVDFEIEGLNDRLEKIPVEINHLYSICKGITDEINHIKKEIESHNKERREKERVVEIENDHLSKVKAKLPLVKTNEEYSAILKEIDGVKEKIKKLEDEDLALMELIEEKGRIQKEREIILKEEENKFQKDKTEKENEMEKLKNLAKERQMQRESISSPIDKKVFQDYAKVFKNRGGMAVVKFSEGICQGCFLGLPPQLASEIRKNEEIIKCPHCQRILYWTGG